eukprot:2920869-Prymnesium_polylepis.1
MHLWSNRPSKSTPSAARARVALLLVFIEQIASTHLASLSFDSSSFSMTMRAGPPKSSASALAALGTWSTASVRSKLKTCWRLRTSFAQQHEKSASAQHMKTLK